MNLKDLLIAVVGIPFALLLVVLFPKDWNEMMKEDPLMVSEEFNN